jgi:DNA-binding LytR/AlgR family response regulator
MYWVIVGIFYGLDYYFGAREAQIRAAQLEGQLAKAESQQSAGPPALEEALLLIKAHGRLLFLRMSELKWVEAEKDYVRLHMEKDIHFIRDTTNNVERRPEGRGFIRIHRSTSVNVHEVSEIQPLLGGDSSVVLRDKTQLTFRRRYRSSLDDFLERKRACLPKSV